MSQRRVVSASELAEQEIRELIDSGSLRPGQRVNHEELAQRLRISRTPVRDALQTLRAEGLVDIVPRVGVFVRRISQAEAQDVYRIKAALEPLAAEWAAQRASQSDKSDLQEIVRALRAAVELNDVHRSSSCVDSLHLRMFEAAKSEALLEAFRVISGRVKVLRALNMAQPGRLSVSLRQHAAIVQAVVAGDGERAGEIMRTHMLDAARAVGRIFEDGQICGGPMGDEIPAEVLPVVDGGP